LPSGDYIFEIFCIDRFGNKSNVIRVPIYVNKVWYKRFDFLIFSLGLIVLVFYFYFNTQRKRNEKRLEYKLQNAQKIMELEQEALKAQMNPHFIFNCLNAIQHYIIEKDVMSANKFISSFAGLIRQALDNSGRKNISLEEEIIFLKSYIEIEQNRFEDKFYYSIKVEEQLDITSLQIPPMLIQPFVENAINHGLLNKKNEKGNLVIDFSMLDNLLKIIISDNGIGRVAAKSFSSYKELLHVSKGIQLTQSRINKLNDSENNKIRMTIEDKYDTIGNSTGTQVELFIPLFCKN
jgi:sensor histidine kinase YesM